MRSDTEPPSVHFQPLRPASRRRLVVGIVLGPLLWLVALAVAAYLFAYSWAIQVGLLVAAASFIVSLIVLALLREGRRREENRYVARG